MTKPSVLASTTELVLVIGRTVSVEVVTELLVTRICPTTKRGIVEKFVFAR